MPQTPRCFLETLPCHLPQATIPDDCDAQAVASAFASNLGDLNESHFFQDAIWRDSFALTGSLRTFYTVDTLLPIWRDLVKKCKAHSFGTIPFIARVMRANQESAWVDAMFEFETAEQPASLCTLAVSLVPCPDGKWRIWVLGTLLEQLIGAGNVDKLDTGNTHVGHGQSQAAEPSGNNHHFDCVIVGGGQAGLSTGGRCQALELSYVILESNSEVGGNWRKRYDSAKLHTIREYSHLPFERTFGADYPEYLTKDDLANGYAMWAERFGVNVWLSTRLETGNWDSDKCTWTLKIRRAEREIIVRTANVVLAIGPGGQIPSMPALPNRDEYQGIIQHSVNYTSARAWKGKRGLVVGIANTAHDVAEDMLAAGLSSVTMIQRSRTYVMPHEYFQKISKLSYNEHVPTEVADRAGYWVPFAVTRLLALEHLGKMASNEPERFDALERAGFKTERYGDIVHQLYEKMGRYYMDVGASEKIAKGLISVRSGVEPAGYITNGLRLSDGSVVEADVVVFATGFKGNIRDRVREFFGNQVADVMEDFWGFDTEGELRGAFRSPGHPGLWCIGGSLGQARYMSRFIALQIKAAVMGTPLPTCNVGRDQRRSN